MKRGKAEAVCMYDDQSVFVTLRVPNTPDSSKELTQLLTEYLTSQGYEWERDVRNPKK